MLAFLKRKSTTIRMPNGTYDSCLQLLHKVFVTDDLLAREVLGDFGDRDLDLAVGLKQAGVNAASKLVHVMHNFFLGLHRRDVNLAKHKLERLKTAFSLFALSTFVGHLC